jgi:hypothetical protein
MKKSQRAAGLRLAGDKPRVLSFYAAFGFNGVAHVGIGAWTMSVTSDTINGQNVT